MLFYAYLDRAEIYQKLAEKCDYQRTFEPCYEALKLAQVDYERALAVAKKLGYSGLAQQTEGFLRRLGQRRELIQSQEALHKNVLQMAIFHPKKPSDVLVHEQFIAGSQTHPWRSARAHSCRRGDSPVVMRAAPISRAYCHEMQGANDAALPIISRSG